MIRSETPDPDPQPTPSPDPLPTPDPLRRPTRSPAGPAARTPDARTVAGTAPPPDSEPPIRA
jgi:hypothetical protein